MATVLDWTQPGKEKRILRENTEDRRLDGKCCAVDTTLNNKLVELSEDAYLSNLNNSYNGYATKTTIYLITHPHKKYAHISATYMTADDEQLCSTWNNKQPLESLSKRFNECTDFTEYTGMTHSPLPQNQGKLTLPLFWGYFLGIFAWFY